MNFKNLLQRKTRVRLCPACNCRYMALNGAKIVKARSVSDCDMNSLRFNMGQIRNLIELKEVK